MKIYIITRALTFLKTERQCEQRKQGVFAKRIEITKGLQPLENLEKITRGLTAELLKTLSSIPLLSSIGSPLPLVFIISLVVQAVDLY